MLSIALVVDRCSAGHYLTYVINYIRMFERIRPYKCNLAGINSSLRTPRRKNTKNSMPVYNMLAITTLCLCRVFPHIQLFWVFRITFHFVMSSNRKNVILHTKEIQSLTNRSCLCSSINSKLGFFKHSFVV